MCIHVNTSNSNKLMANIMISLARILVLGLESGNISRLVIGLGIGEIGPCIIYS